MRLTGTTAAMLVALVLAGCAQAPQQRTERPEPMTTPVAEEGRPSIAKEGERMAENVLGRGGLKQRMTDYRQSVREVQTQSNSQNQTAYTQAADRAYDRLESTLNDLGQATVQTAERPVAEQREGLVESAVPDAWQTRLDRLGEMNDMQSLTSAQMKERWTTISTLLSGMRERAGITDNAPIQQLNQRAAQLTSENRMQIEPQLFQQADQIMTQTAQALERKNPEAVR
jgi:hypothetical protein